MKVDIISDVACPWCYIGKKNLEGAMAQRPDINFEVQWFPYQLHPEAPAAGYNYRETITRKYGADRITAMFAHITQAGKASGIDFHFEKLERGANTLQAHRLLDFAWPQGLQNALAEALFEAYFCRGMFVGDNNVLTDLAVNAGMEREQVKTFLAGDEATHRVREQIEFARHNGVMGVPSFSFDGMFAISGGQTTDVFLNAIDHIHQKSLATSAACTPESCP